LLDDYDFAGLRPAEQVCQASAAAAAAAVAAANRRDARVAVTLPAGWRNVVSQPQLTSFAGPRGRVDVSYYWTRAGIAIARVATERAADAADAAPDAADGEDGPSMTVAGLAPDEVTLDVAGVRYRFDITRAGAEIWVGSALGSVRLTLLDRLPAPERAAESGSLVAPMPGSVTRIATAPGDRVVAGQLVLVLEAMKMEHQIVAPAGGVLAQLRVSSGAQVNAGDVLAIVTAGEANEPGSDDARR
jgi:propionyl-CoA carboxylase alpha chain